MPRFKTSRLLWAMQLVTTCVLSACGSSGADEHAADEQAPPISDPIANAAPIPAPTSLVCPKGTLLTYENFGEGFMLNHCTMCHSKNLATGQRGGAPVGVDLDSPEDVSIWRGSILMTTATPGPAATETKGDASTRKLSPMPPSQQVPSGELTLLAEWLNCGAPGTRQRIK